MTHSLTKTHSYSERRTLTIIAAVILILLAALFISEKLNFTHYFGSSDANTQASKPTKQQQEQEKKSNATAKETFANQTDDLGNPKTPTSPPDSSLSLAAEKSDTDVIVKARMQAVADGKCSLEITSNGKSFAQEADVIYQPTFSSCAGFSVPIVAVGSGVWNITLRVTPLNGAPLSKTIQYKVDG